MRLSEYFNQDIEIRLLAQMNDNLGQRLFHIINNYLDLKREFKIPYSQGDILTSRQLTSYKKLTSLNYRFNGLCEVISNSVISQDFLSNEMKQEHLQQIIINKIDEITAPNIRLETKHTALSKNLTLSFIDVFSKTHILDVSSYYKKILALFFDIYPFDICSVRESREINYKQNYAIIIQKLNALPNNSYVKFEAFKKSFLQLTGHSMVIKKINTNQFHFFDPNTGSYYDLDNDALIKIINEKKRDFNSTHVTFIEAKHYFQSISMPLAESVSMESFKQEKTSISSSLLNQLMGILNQFDSGDGTYEQKILLCLQNMRTIFEKELSPSIPNLTLGVASSRYIRDKNQSSLLNTLMKNKLKTSILPFSWYVAARLDLKTLTPELISNKLKGHHGFIYNSLGNDEENTFKSIDLHFFNQQTQKLQSISSKDPYYATIKSMCEEYLRQSNLTLLPLEAVQDCAPSIEINSSTLVRQLADYKQALLNTLQTHIDVIHCFDNLEAENSLIFSLIKDKLPTLIKTPTQLATVVEGVSEAVKDSSRRKEIVIFLLDALLEQVTKKIFTARDIEAHYRVINKPYLEARFAIWNIFITHPEETILTVADLADVIKHMDIETAETTFLAILKRMDEITNNNEDTFYDYIEALRALPEESQKKLIPYLLKKCDTLFLEDISILLGIKKSLSQDQFQHLILHAAPAILNAFFQEAPKLGDFDNINKNDIRLFLNECGLEMQKILFDNKLPITFTIKKLRNMLLMPEVFKESHLIENIIAGFPDNIESVDDGIYLLHLNILESNEPKTLLIQRIASLIKSRHDAEEIIESYTLQEYQAIAYKLVETLHLSDDFGLKEEEAELLIQAIVYESKDKLVQFIYDIMKTKPAYTYTFQWGNNRNNTLNKLDELPYAYQHKIKKILNIKDNISISSYLKTKFSQENPDSKPKLT